MDTSTSEPDAIATARAEQSTLAASPFVPERTRQAADENFITAYRAKYGDAPASKWASLTEPATLASTPPGFADATATVELDPAIATMSPERVRARITAIDGLLKTVTDSDDERVLLADKQACYMRLYPEPKAGEAPPPEPIAPLTLAVSPALLQEHGLTVHHAALAEIGDALDRHGIPREEAEHWGRVAVEELQHGVPPASVEEGKAECRAKLIARYGAAGAQTILDDVNYVFRHLSPVSQAAVLNTRLGLNDGFAEWLANCAPRFKPAAPPA
jgi:hypothetical protein